MAASEIAPMIAHVAPFTGARIETPTLTQPRRDDGSRPSRARGSKPRLRRCARRPMSRPSRACGSKHRTIERTVDSPESRPSRACGSKHVAACRLRLRTAGRALHGRADRNSTTPPKRSSLCRSRPSRARGSKHVDRRVSASGPRRALHGRADRNTRPCDAWKYAVAPFTGVRIETISRCRPSRARTNAGARSRPSRARGSKHRAARGQSAACWSRPSRARGSKHPWAPRWSAATEVAPFTGARIETLAQRGSIRTAHRRALHGRADRNLVSGLPLARPTTSRALHGRADRNSPARRQAPWQRLSLDFGRKGSTGRAVILGGLTSVSATSRPASFRACGGASASVWRRITEVTS